MTVAQLFRTFAGRLPSVRILKMTSWATVSFGSVQAIRLASNVVLTRLLSPELFGVMLIINTLRTGAELFTNVGIGENVVSNPHGEDPRFYNTAWTLQLIRGVLLTLVFGLAAIPLARFYETPILAWAIPVFSLSLLIGGAASPARFLLQKRLEVAKLGIFDISIALASAIGLVVFALVSPTIWALVWGAVFTSVIAVAGTFFLIRGMSYRLQIHRAYTFQILHFGKWIFLSSIIMFLASNFDRLFVGKALPLGIVGIYGVARSLADMLGTLVGQIGSLIVFPSVAASTESRPELRRRIKPLRLKAIILLAAGVSLFALSSGLVVQILYDARYQAAASMLPILCIGVWFSMLSSLNEAVLLGLRQQGFSLLANGLKFGCLVLVLSIGIGPLGIFGAVWAVALAEFVRFALVSAGLRKHGTSFLKQDVGATLVVLAAVVAAVQLWGA